MKRVEFNPLKQGDIIDLVAPGFSPNPQDVKGALKWLRHQGYEARLPQGSLKGHFLHSHSDEKRFHFLKSALNRQDSEVIWCLRGGYGSNRLWPELLRMKKPRKAKLILGLSDITSLQNFVTQFWGWPCLHASHLDRLGGGRAPRKIVDELLKVLRGEQPHSRFSSLRPLNRKAKNLKSCVGSVTGGNLITLQSSVGTKTEIDVENKILFIEEIGERAYRIDRALVHLRQSGVLDSANAIVFGEFLSCEEPDGKALYKKVLQRFADEMVIPVFSGLPMGHGEIQRPLFFGTPALLVGGTRATLEVQSAILPQSRKRIRS